MSLEVNFLKKNDELQKRVLIEIENVKMGNSKKSISQLYTILEELNAMCGQLNLVLGYPGIIIDSWDYSDRLGLDLIDLSALYKKVTKL